jgi:hypothetical protein
LRRRTSGPPPPEDGSAAGTATRARRDSHGGWLPCSACEAARLTGLSRDPLHDQMPHCNLARVNVDRWRLITGQHPQQFPGIIS